MSSRSTDQPQSTHEDAPRGELGWIEWIRRRAPQCLPDHNAALQLGIGDDCAILRPALEEDLVVTTDFSLESRHFRRDWHPAASAGHRTLARGLSDLAAMGARPLAAFLSLAMPVSDTRNPFWMEQFLSGLLTLAERFAVPLAGGDTSQSPSEHVLADIVLLGAVPRGTALRRSGARPGDELYVTGSLGGAAAELNFLSTENSKSENPKTRAWNTEAPENGSDALPTRHPQLYPEPRLSIGQALRSNSLASSCMDLSDGLSTDLHHLCQASGVGARVELEALPPSPWLSWLSGFKPAKREALMLHGGEDYELLFTAPASASVPQEIDGVRLSRIGEIVSAEGSLDPVTIRRNGREEPLRPAGWEHLRG